MEVFPNPRTSVQEDPESYLRISCCFVFMTTTVHVFNQYYWDLLKKSKNLAKDLKHKASADTEARVILREIKNSYMSFDKTSEEHVQWYREHVAKAWQEFASDKKALDDWNNWYENVDSIVNLELYKGISMGTLMKVYKSKDVVLYYFLLLSVFANDSVSAENVSKVLELLRNKRTPFTEDEVQFLEDPFVATSVRLLHELSMTQAASVGTGAASGSSSQDSLLSELENTTLGKLAKEIMNDVNVDEIQQSIGDGGDILKAFSDPNGKMSQLIGTVTQKMVSKLASGELKQDSLLNDAMKLAGALPGGGAGGMFEQISKMAGMFGGGGAGGDDEGFDIASMMKNMMGGGKAGGGGNRGSRAVVNSAALTRNVKAKQLRRKLEERRKVKENIETQ